MMEQHHGKETNEEQEQNGESCLPKLTRFGIKYNPPTLMVEYSKSDPQGHSKICHHKIEFHNDAFHSMTTDYLEKVLYQNLSKTLETLVALPNDGKKTICLQKMKNLVSKLYSFTSKTKHETISDSYRSDSTSNLNIVSDEVLIKVKDEMDEMFQVNKIDVNAEEYVYDKRVDFDEVLSNSSWD